MLTCVCRKKPKFPASVTDALISVNDSLSHLVYAHFKCVFVFGVGDKWACIQSFKDGFSIPFYSSILFLDIIPIGFQSQVFEGLVSVVQNCGWGTWCRAQIPCLSGKILLIANFYVWGLFVFFCSGLVKPCVASSAYFNVALLSFDVGALFI